MAGGGVHADSERATPQGRVTVEGVRCHADTAFKGIGGGLGALVDGLRFAVLIPETGSIGAGDTVYVTGFVLRDSCNETVTIEPALLEIMAVYLSNADTVIELNSVDTTALLQYDVIRHETHTTLVKVTTDSCMVSIILPLNAAATETLALAFDFAESVGNNILITRGDSVALGQGTDAVGHYDDFSMGIFDISVVDDTGANVGGDPARFDSVVLTLMASDTLLTRCGVTSADIKLYTCTAAVWREVDGAIISRSGNAVSAGIAHFTIYCFFPAAGVGAIRGDRNGVLVFPNPFKPHDGDPETGREYTGAANTGVYISGLTQSVEIRIYNIAGELIDELDPTGTGAVQWDARNRHGREVAGGTYLIVIRDRVTGQTVVKKLAVIQ